LLQIWAANIKEQRGILGVSQEKLAEMAGLSWQTVNSLECRRTWAGDGTLEALAQVFNIETLQLLMPPETKATLSLHPDPQIQGLSYSKPFYQRIVKETTRIFG
jgi:transcriptional regulator with XRE-family HTH domain